MANRKTNQLVCCLCKNTWSSAYFGQHLKKAHNISSDDYAKKFGEYRINQLRSGNIIKNSDVKLTCKECNNDVLYTDVSLSYHLRLKHGISKEQYILKHYLNNVMPKCGCGCGGDVKILHYVGEIHRKFISGHNANPMLGNKHKEESKSKMSKSASVRIKDAKKSNIILPWHSVDAIKKRGKSYSNNLMEKKSSRYNIKITSTYEEQQNSLYKFTCLICNTTHIQCHNSYFICGKCHPRIRSKTENELYDFLNADLKINDIIRNYRKPFNGTYEIDLYLPVYNIGIEYNGLYWHSEIGGAKFRNYHLNKMKVINEKGIRLIQIFSDDWYNNKELIKSKLRHILNKNNGPKLYAKKSNVLDIDNPTKKDFLIKNHIQGNDVSAIRLGCYYNNELVSVMTFSKLSVSKGYSNTQSNVYELSRFCSLKDAICVGMFGKLFNHFIEKYSPDKIITYADLCWSDANANVYKKNNFIYDGITSPNYWYTNDYKNRLHRYQFTKHKLVKMGYDRDLTEWEIMQSMNYDRVWDCGHIRYTWIK